MSWNSIHIFYYDNQDFLLREGLYQVMSENQIEQFFFIRYWENGPHIRLRINNISDELFRKVKKEICDFVSQNSSKMTVDENKYMKMSIEFGKRENICSDNMNLIQNNTVKDWDYIPELEKYHGIKCVAIAEKEFIYSSKLAMLILLMKPLQSKKYFFSSVYALMILNNIFKSNSEVHIFLSNYIKYWKRFSGFSNEDFLKLENNTKNYPVNIKALNSVKEFYINHSFNLLHTEIFYELGELLKNDENVLERFCFNFIHLFNNRLGMVPAEEVIMGYICKKILGEMEEKQI